MEVRAGLGVVTAAVLAGEVLATACTAAPAVLVTAVLAALGCWRWRGHALWCALVTVGLATGALRMEGVLRPTLPASHVARLPLPYRGMLTGRIVAAPERRDRRMIAVVAAEAVGRGRGRRVVSGLVRVAIRDPGRRWRYGDRLAFETTIRQPRNFENPGRFDWVGHLARQGIYATAAVWNGHEVAHLPGRSHDVRARLERWRARIATAIAFAVPGAEGAVLQALVVGDESGIDPPLRDAFTRAGVVHVLSISGLHVGLVAAAAFALVRRLLGRSERLLLGADVVRLAAVASLGPVVLYAALAGLGVATLRSAIMVVAAAIAALVGRRADVLRTLALAALGLALVWPGAPLEIAFQLSFLSVAAIVCGTRRLGGDGGSGWGARVRQALVASPCALAGTAPLTAFHFHQISLVGVVANPITIPIFGALVVIPGLVGAAVEPAWPAAAAVLFRIAGVVLVPGIALVRTFARPTWAAVDVPIPNLVELTLVYGVLVGVLLRPRRVAIVVVGFALGGLLVDVGWWVHVRFGSRLLRITFLDVGQGDAAVAELPDGRVLVVDAGGFPAGDFDTGAAVVSPFLLSRKILHVDALAMTHAHPDHSGGIPYLLAHHDAGAFWWTGVPGEGLEWERLEAALAGNGTPVQVLTAGTPSPWADAVAVLHPPADAGAMTLNDSSLTLRLGPGGPGVLLTGDIEAHAEARLLAEADRIAAAVLKVPHHGSRTSSTPRFVEAVAPRIAVVSVGADNRYGLPSPEVEARYRERGTCVLRTDRCGAITVEIDGSRLAVWSVRGCRCPASLRFRPPS